MYDIFNFFVYNIVYIDFSLFDNFSHYSYQILLLLIKMLLKIIVYF